MRLLVVGGDAAGMSAAHQALRVAAKKGETLEVIVLERTAHTSYSACGLPYWIAGDVDDGDKLVARSPERHRQMGIDLRTGTTARTLDLARGVVTASVDGEPGEVEFAFDRLVLATGATPIVPGWARRDDGSLVAGSLPVKTLTDASAWLDLLAAGTRPRRAVVVGAGYLGLEMSETLLRRGLEVTLLTRSEVMSSLDPAMGARIRDHLTAAGIKVLTGVTPVGLETGPDGRVTAVVTAGGEQPADVVVLAMGVSPATALGVGAGLPVGDQGGYLPDEGQRVAENVWAAGDCCESVDRITGDRVLLPLGTHANKQGRVAGTVLAGGEARFAGTLGTAITRFVAGDTHVEIARVGLTTARAAGRGFDAVSLVTEGTTASGYMPEAAPIATNIIADRASRRLLGGQIVGGPGSGKRIDTLATAIWFGASVDDLVEVDLSYAPPFATTWEAVQIATRRLAERL